MKTTGIERTNAKHNFRARGAIFDTLVLKKYGHLLTSVLGHFGPDHLGPIFTRVSLFDLQNPNPEFLVALIKTHYSLRLE